MGQRGDTPAPWNPPGHRSAAPAWRPHSILGRARPLSLSSPGTPCPRGLWMCPGGSPVAGAPSPPSQGRWTRVPNPRPRGWHGRGVQSRGIRRGASWYNCSMNVGRSKIRIGKQAAQRYQAFRELLDFSEELALAGMRSQGLSDTQGWKAWCRRWAKASLEHQKTNRKVVKLLAARDKVLQPAPRSAREDRRAA